ncbi:MAG TPA: hypothetical protein DCM86_18600 [Verrucomicrobiales bacterium]|nr:hypothetical protein [Verrucomicrobiales bacterium]
MPSLTSPAASPSSPTGLKKWLFRGLVMLGVPIALLWVAELGLRAIGYGHPTRFLIPVPERAGFLRENPAFGWRFFPKSMARAPQTLMVAREKPANTIRVVVLGESAAKGEPEPAYSFGRILGTLLSDRFPDRHFEVINTAVTAINSHAILPIARDVAELSPDFWVIYMGNNEVMGPFGPGTVFGAHSSNLPVLRAALAFKGWRLGQGLESLLGRLRPTATPASWEGLEMFLKSTLPPDDPRLEGAYRCFEQNVADILGVAARSGGETLLCTVGVNLRDSAPFASLHRQGLPASEERRFAELLTNAVTRLESGDATNALAQLDEAARIDPGYAEIPFQTGRALLSLRRTTEARSAFQRACDLDALRFRADSRQNEILRRQAAAPRGGCRLVDVAQALADQAPDGVPGDESFHEYVHLSFDGNHRVALLLAGPIAESLDRRGIKPGGRPWLSAAESASRLGLTDWHRLEIEKGMRSRLSRPPFTQESTWRKRDQALRGEMARLAPAAKPESFSPQAEACRAALERTPDDWMLRDQYARLMAAFRRIPEASNAWSRVLQEVPHHFLAAYQLGTTLNQTREHAAAEPFLRRALAMRPDLPEANEELGVCLGHQRRVEEGEVFLARALQLRPGNGEVQFSWATMLTAVGRLTNALPHYEATLALSPRNAQARLNLSRVLMELGRFDPAAVQLRELVRQQPESYQLRFLLADALTGARDTNAALTELQGVLQEHPESLEARNRLGIELSKRGRWEDAEGQFMEIVQRRPEDLAPRINLGRLYMEASRFEDAETQFKEALRLQPTNRLTADYLQKARAKLAAPRQ